MKTFKISLFALIIFTGFFCTKDNAPEILEVRSVVGDYYVSPSGDDSNPGTDSLPWRTIQKAAITVAVGKIVVIRSGSYDEYVTISNGGTDENNRIIFFSETLHGARCRGFKIQGGYVTIDGFDVEAVGSTNWVGIRVTGASFVDVLNCFVHECPTGGINIGGARDVRVVDNIIEHNGQWGINLIGSNGLIEGNEISRTVQHHPKGHEPGFSGADADGMRIFGDNHIIRGNIVKDIGDPSDNGNIDPHVDCIQTWDGYTNSQPLMTNTIIEGNFFSVKHKTGKGIVIDANRGNACHHLMIRNNVFEFSDIGIGAYTGEFHDIFVYNNVFKATIGESSWGTSVSFKNVINYALLNNITVDCHPEHRHIEGGTGVVDYNLAWNSDGSTHSMLPALQANELDGINPQFVTYTGNHGENNYHLSKSSPAINTALTLEDVLNDFDGITRPQGTGYDRGAFEYHDDK
ncbi:MAG: right-handed parallel beta-helix repeat-containing protein [Bacteroidota bacterium]